MNTARGLRLLAAVLVYAGVGALLRSYTTDDTFIHLRYAQNFLETGNFAFNPGEETYGATSPLWIFGLVLLLKLGVPALTAPWILGMISGLVVILVFEAIVHRMTLRDRWKFLVVLLIVFDAWFLRWSYSGMETPLATLSLLIILWPLFSGRDMGWGLTREPLWHRYLGWGVAAGLTGLVRPEYLLLAPLALPFLLWFEYFRAGATGGLEARHRARPHAPAMAAAAGWLIPVGPWFLFALFRFGRLFPETASAKSGVFSLAPGPLFQSIFRSVSLIGATQGFLIAGTVMLILVVLWRHRHVGGQGEPWSEWGNRGDEEGAPEDLMEPAPGYDGWSVWGPVGLVGIAAVWTTVLIFGFAVSQVWVISRYLSPLSPVLLLSMTVVVEWLMRGSAITSSTRVVGRFIVIISVVATLVLNSWIFFAKVLPHARNFTTGVETCYLETGDWLRLNTEPETVVAALDIGAIGYASERQVLDLMGLVSPEVLVMGREMGFAEMVESGRWLDLEVGGRRATYFVDRSEGNPRWENRTVRGVRFELLSTCIIRGVGLAEPQPWTVALYRLVPVTTRVKSSTGG